MSEDQRDKSDEERERARCKRIAQNLDPTREYHAVREKDEVEV